MRARWHAVAAVLVLCGVTAFLFAPLLAGAVGGPRRFFEWDVPDQYWPDLVYLCGSLRDGVLPYWNPYDRAGYPYYADPQAATYHPLNWAICGLSGGSPALWWAEARVVLGFLASGLFGLLWLRRWRLPWGAALLGAVVLEVAPFMRHNWELNLTAALAWLPLILWAADRAAVERRTRDAALLAIAVASCAWTGSPPALWLCVSFAAPFTLWRLAEETIVHGRAALARGALVLLAAAVLTAGLSAAVVGPGLRLASHSIQAGRSLESIGEGALAPGHLLALLWPRPGNHLYLGLMVLLLAVPALLARNPARRVPARWFMLLAAVVAVLMALGTSGPLFGPAFAIVPGVSLFRLPHRYEAWLGPAAAALAAGGLAWLDSPSVRDRLARHVTPVRLGAAALAAAGVILAIATRAWGPASALIGAALVTLALTIPRLGATHLVTGSALAALLVFDVTQTLPPERHTAPGPPPGSAAAAAPVLERAPGTGGRHRYMDEFGVALRSGTRLLRRDFRGYQDPLLLKSYERVLASLAEHPGLLEQYGVRYVLTGPHFIHGWNRHFAPPPERLRALPGAVDRGLGVVELTRALPPAYWVDAAMVTQAADRPAALEQLAGMAPAPVAILDGAVTNGSPFRPAGRDGAAPVSWVEATRYELSRDAVVIAIEAPAAGVVVVNEAWYPGWRATVDGSPAPVLRANALVRAVPVGPGAHEIVLTFEPSDGVALRWTLAASLLATLALLVVPALRDRARSRGGASGRPGRGGLADMERAPRRAGRE